MPGKAQMMLMLATVAAIACQPARAQSGRAAAAARSDSPDPAKTLRAAAEALGMLRWSDIGTATIHLPAIDVVNTMELWGSGTAYVSGQASKTEYHVSLAYNPAAMRVEMTRASSSAGAPGAAAPSHTIQVVRDAYAWDESELGGGLVPGKGTATPAAAALKGRLLQLWTLPYGVVKAGLAAGDKTKISTENGATVITFPLSGELVGVTVKATLNPRNEIAKVETRADNAALGEMLTETDYSDYADHGEILTDIKSPGHIVQKQGGRSVLDIQVKMVDANNPYLVFPVPDNIKKASAR
jgi:hypothetical protein